MDDSRTDETGYQCSLCAEQCRCSKVIHNIIILSIIFVCVLSIVVINMTAECQYETVTNLDSELEYRQATNVDACYPSRGVWKEIAHYGVAVYGIHTICILVFSIFPCWLALSYALPCQKGGCLCLVCWAPEPLVPLSMRCVWKTYSGLLLGAYTLPIAARIFRLISDPCMSTNGWTKSSVEANNIIHS